MAGNLFMQMFGPMRHVNPRASGLIVFKGGSNGATLSEVEDAIKKYGDPKFTSVMGGQGDISDDISDALSDSLAQMRANDKTVTTGFQNLTGDVKDVSRDLGTLDTTVDKGFTSMGRRFDTVDDDLGDGFDDLTADMKTYTGNTTSAIKDRFDAQDKDFGIAMGKLNDQVLDSEGNLSKAAQSYFSDLVKNLSGVTTDVNKNVNEQVGNLDDRVKDFQTDTGNSLDTLGTDLRGGQKNIQEAVDKGNANATDYFDTLNKGQEGLMSDLGDFSGRFDAFRGQYDNDTTLANRSRNDLLSAMGASTNAVTDAVANSTAATNAGIDSAEENLAGRITATSNATNQNLNRSTNRLSGAVGGAARDIMSGVEATTDEQIAAREDFTSGLGAMRSALNSNMDGLDANMRNQFQGMTDAFDENGKLLSEDISANGNQIRRAIDSTGNLIVSEFDAQGNRINQMGYNIDDMFAALGDLQGSSIGTMGLLSAPINRSPYART